jgi:hypothetical protein
MDFSEINMASAAKLEHVTPDKSLLEDPLEDPEE